MAEGKGPPWQDLDAGIVAVVRVLREAGYITTDSGDGSKADWMECALDFPHVFCAVEPATMVKDCVRALGLDYSGAGLQPLAPTTCEVSYSALDGKAVLLVAWPPQERRYGV